MKLTIREKDRIRDAIIADLYPDQKVAKMFADLSKEVEKLPAVADGIRWADKHKDYLHDYWPNTDVTFHTDHEMNWGLLEKWVNRHLVEVPKYVHNKVKYPKGITLDKCFDELTKEGQKIYWEIIHFAKGKRDLTENLKKIMKTVTTSKQLIETLPDAEKYIVKPTDQATALIPIETINYVRNAMSGKEKKNE